MLNIFKGRKRLWIGLTLFSALVMTPMVVIQFKQKQLIQEVTDTQYDSITWQFFQLEREQGKLLRVLDRVGSTDVQPSADELIEQYEIYVSRLIVIKDFQSTASVEKTPAYPTLLKELDAIVMMADPIFAEPDTLLTRQNDLNDLTSRLLNVEPLLREMTREASRATSLFLEERNQQIQQQGKAVTTLTVLQLLLLLCLVVLLVRHINRQQSQYLSLKLLSGQLESARSEAERANQAKSVFLANMSHEIRTPFQGLMGMLNLLKSTELNNAQRDYVETALDSAQHLLGVLNDILDMSTIDSGSFKLLISTVNLEELTGNTQELMSQVAADKGIDLQFEFDNTLPRWVRGDAMRIRQILFNLIGNAIKFTQQGEVRIIVTAKDGNDEVVSIVVQDTGAGMDDATLERLFTRFYQADNSFLRKMGGTGLGLEISRSLARMMGGDITVTSKLGQGSRFELTLKLPEATAPLQSQEDPQVQPAAYQSLRLLVAEDHPINLKYMNLLLDKMGHEAVFCGNGLEALELLKRQSFDAVLLDYHMPELDGISTAKAIRSMVGSSSTVKIMLVTADVVGEVKNRAEDAGVDCFVSKPLTLSDLNQALLACGLLIARTPSSETILAAPDLTEVLEGLNRQFPLVVDLAVYQQLVPFSTCEARAELLTLALAPVTGCVDVLIKAMTDGEPKAIALAAHNLKGACMMLGLSSLVNAASEIESSSDQLSVADVARWKATLRHLANRSYDEVATLEMMMEDTPQPF
ncbi:MAG: ATP-binding protein [Hydrogenophaga sp.]|uniref:ATP-binding protein n=1 Tax=Hydrogenophaga sp. TaxID=1904254 RepID=UPI0027360B75|nr:ATP-binding protein [Hydrogenophaga sp.]MDP3350425.1 ATP-binding protein [Hydrogenophaga sp.]